MKEKLRSGSAKSVKEKLRSRSAETLAETLVGIMIAALASALFLSMVTLSSRMNKMAQDADKLFYDTMSLLECGETKADDEAVRETDMSVSVSIEGAGIGGASETLESFQVKAFYGNDMSSYRSGGETPESGGGS